MLIGPRDTSDSSLRNIPFFCFRPSRGFSDRGIERSCTLGAFPMKGGGVDLALGDYLRSSPGSKETARTARTARSIEIYRKVRMLGGR
jgi:hypothetical protein